MDEWRNLAELGDPNERAAHTMRRRYAGVPERDFPVLDAIANKSSILGPLAEALGPGVPEYGDREAMIERSVPLAALGTGGGMLRGPAPGAGLELGAGGGFLRRMFGGKPREPVAPEVASANRVDNVLRALEDNKLNMIGRDSMARDYLGKVVAGLPKWAQTAPLPELLANNPALVESVIARFHGEERALFKKLERQAPPPREPGSAPQSGSPTGERIEPQVPPLPPREAAPAPAPAPAPESAPGPGTPLGELGRTPAPEPAPAPKPKAKRATSEPADRKRAPRIIDWNRARNAGREEPLDLPSILRRKDED